MRKSKTKFKPLIFLIILINLLSIPVFGLTYFGSNNYGLNSYEKINTEQLNSLITYKKDLRDLDSNFELDGKNSIFDEKLKEYLSGTNSFEKKIPADLKIIILFKSKTTKQERVAIVDSIFDEYELLANYEIISGIFLKINPNHLISKKDSLEEVESIKLIYKSQIYNSPYISEENLNLNSLSPDSYSNWWLSAIGAEDLQYDGTGIRVAVIDTGVYDHPDLNLVENYNFVLNESIQNYGDDVGHGTHVAGIIGGDGSSSSGKYRGVAPGALIINARAGNESGLEEGVIINAIEWSSKPTDLGGAGADIISMSFGGGDASISDSITQAITAAKDNYSVIFVASAGNSGPDYFTGSTPATGIDVISVGATDIDNELASFSSWGPTFGYLSYPDVVAPGVNIISTEAPRSSISKGKRYKGDFFDFPGNADYIPLSGTSMSAPVVSGALAILKQAYPFLTPEMARIALIEGTRKLINNTDDDFLKSGAGLINISASLAYLNKIVGDYNDTAKIFPNDLPVKPYDLLNFPGDRQKFNLTVISGKSNSFDIEVPNNIQGLSILLDKTNILFTTSGIDFIELDIQISKEAIPGIRNFQLNLTNGGQLYDSVNITIDIRLPEYKILMESYHGLNDWFSRLSYYQIGFYDAISDISKFNISTDYQMTHWTPDYNRDFNNSILTEERLSQYDLVVLQMPILPYSSLEMNNLKTYFDNGGNILFLGTRYQDMVVDNVNDLFSKLDIGVEINEENIMDDELVGVGATLDSQGVNNFDNPSIFKNVSKFKWFLGNSFTVSNNAESIATLENKTVVAMYNGTTEGKGRFLAFGDFFWLFNEYKSSTYSQDHFYLLKNAIEYFLPEEEVSINIGLDSESSSDSANEISLYLKNQTTESPISTSDYDSLNVKIENNAFSKTIALNTSHADAGVYFNRSFILPYPSYSPYSIVVNLTINSKNYIKTTKFLFIDKVKIPIINSLSITSRKISRTINNSTDIIVELDASTYGDVNAFLSIYSYSFFNSKKSVNKTLTLNHTSSNFYATNFNPEVTDPSGYGIFYIQPTNSNFTVPNSPRLFFEIINNPPEIVKTTSYFNFGGNSDISFNDTSNDDGSFIYPTSQGTTFNFRVDANDTVNIEEDRNSMRLFVNLFISLVTEDNFIVLISPSSFAYAELEFQLTSDLYEGSFKIPNSMLYNSITGKKSISTASDYNDSTKNGYIGILVVTVYDNEGESENHIIIILISDSALNLDLLVIVIFSIIGLLAITIVPIYFIRRKKTRGGMYTPTPYGDSQYQQYYYETEEDNVSIKEHYDFYCPFCGKGIKTAKKFCPNCGESLDQLGL